MGPRKNGNNLFLTRTKKNRKTFFDFFLDVKIGVRITERAPVKNEVRVRQVKELTLSARCLSLHIVVQFPKFLPWCDGTFDKCVVKGKNRNVSQYNQEARNRVAGYSGEGWRFR